MNDRTGTSVIVTGAGTGIGRACASRVARPGMRMALLGRRLEPLQEVAYEAHRAGAVATPIGCDVRDPASVRAAVARTIETSGGVDILVNGAGIAGGGPTRDEDHDHWNDVIQTNLTGTFLMCQEVLRQGGMVERGWGRIVNIASTGGKQGVVFAAAYTASKHGVVGLTKSLGLELAKTGVTVNTVCPGFVETQIAVHAREAYARIYGITPDEMRRRIEGRVPIGRYIEPNEVAALVEFLISPATDAITAQAWNICGGLGNY